MNPTQPIEFRREITFAPAFDKRSSDESKNYGVHGVNMQWYLHGPKATIQFIVYTNWHLPHVEQELDNRLDSQFPHLCCHPQPADVGYHADEPPYEGCSYMETCTVREAKRCYYDGSGLEAERLFALLVEQGSEAVWKELEDHYNEQFAK